MNTMLDCRLGLQQRVFPSYRSVFFDQLSQVCSGGLSVFAGKPAPDEALGQQGTLSTGQLVHAQNIYLGRGPFLVTWQRGIRSWLESWDPDVLIIDTNPRNISNLSAARWMQQRGRPVIGWGLGAPNRFLRSIGVLSMLIKLLRCRLLLKYDAIISYSLTGARQYESCGFSEDRIFVAPNAVTMRPKLPAPTRPPKYNDGIPCVIFVGRLQARKRVKSLIRACASLPKEIHPRLVIVGEGPARSELEYEAQAAYPETIFTGDKRGTELDYLLAEADLFVLPGTGGLAVQQAMSAALPVMVAEADGTQSSLVRPENGWLLPPNDDDLLAEYLREALSDPARLRQMGLESYRIVAEEVNIERMVEVFVKAVNYACAHRR